MEMSEGGPEVAGEQYIDSGAGQPLGSVGMTGSQAKPGSMVEQTQEEQEQEEVEEIDSRPQMPVAPRLFVIFGDGSGYEYFRKDQLSYYTRQRERDGSLTLSSFLVHNKNPSEHITYFRPIQSYAQIEEELSVLKDIQIPHNLLEKPEVYRRLLEPSANKYGYRTIIKNKDYDHFKRQAFQSDVDRFDNWN